MRSLPGIGEYLDIRHIVIHQLKKEAGSRQVQLRAAARVLEIGAKERIFLGNLDTSYHKKSNPVYGVFAAENTAFRDHLSAYVKGHTTFYDFSLHVATHYKSILEHTVAASGGFMILCAYGNTITRQDLVLVLMINNKEGFVVNEHQLTLDNVKNLDLGKVDVACMVNLTAWQEIAAGREPGRTTYLSFVQGLKKVSNYFMTFIDADNKNTSRESTKRLVDTLEAYAETQQWDRHTRISTKNSVFAYCRECTDQKKEILLATISSIVNKHEPEHFKEFALERPEQVSAIISGDLSRMKLLNTISHAGPGFKIEFDTRMILDNLIVLDQSGEKLTIKNIPPALRDQILKINND